MSGPQATFLARLAQGRFMLQRRRTTGEYVFYPRYLPSELGDVEWVDARGLGIIYSATTIRRKVERGGDYCVALVTLDEGPRLMARIEGIASELGHDWYACAAPLRSPRLVRGWAG